MRSSLKTVLLIGMMSSPISLARADDVERAPLANTVGRFWGFGYSAGYHARAESRFGWNRYAPEHNLLAARPIVPHAGSGIVNQFPRPYAPSITRGGDAVTTIQVPTAAQSTFMQPATPSQTSAVGVDVSSPSADVQPTPPAVPCATGPQATALQVTAPQIATPQVTTPHVTTPHVTTPHVTTPNAAASRAAAPRATASRATGPQVSSPSRSRAPGWMRQLLKPDAGLPDEPSTAAPRESSPSDQRTEPLPTLKAPTDLPPSNVAAPPAPAQAAVATRPFLSVLEQ